ncbi:MAG TPA: lytic transglycosylase domain-containing protein [Trebonia sp.]|nr:lytic transglycosylase domain-containing protein [Trebonia sp.]
MTVRRGSLPVVVGVGAVAVSVAVAAVITVLSGAPGGPGPDAGRPPAAAASGGPGGGSAAPGGGTSVDAAGMTVNLPAAGAHVGQGTDPWASSTAPATATSPAASPAGAAPQPGSPPRQLVVPDVIAAAPGGITAADLAAIRRLPQVRSVLAIDGARISVNGQPLNVLAAPAASLRPWTPPETAASTTLWSDLARGDLITTTQAASGLHLRSGRAYPVTAATSGTLSYGTDALLGVPGVDGIVSQAQGARLGLVKNVAVLINAPAAQMDALVTKVTRIVGSGGQVVRLVPEEVTSTRLPVDTSVPTGRPTNYLMLYQESAARYCAGLSWTVLAAIGEIESDNGQNMGPSTAGALGPMQFLPSTWATWGTDGFGDTGKPNIMNPFDAVPSAARLLCADGAAKGGQALQSAIFDYNHATWYVNEVLTLADEYAREYG